MISDLTPTQDAELSLDLSGIMDANGLVGADFTYEWQSASSASGPWAAIAGATAATFIPTGTEVTGVSARGRLLY